MTNNMARDGDLPTIFNPRRVRTPSVIVTSEEFIDSNGLPSPRAPLTPQGSVTSQPIPHHNHFAEPEPDDDFEDKSCRRSCCSESARKIYYGACVTIVISISWVLATHSIKYLYIRHQLKNGIAGIFSNNPQLIFKNHTSKTAQLNAYDAPFFTTWFCTNWCILFYPIYIIVRLTGNKCQSVHKVLTDSFRNFREKGFTFGHFITRCGLFCLLWVVSTYLYIYSLRILWAADAQALFVTNVSCVYLLSWVILHEQFVGVRIVAVILCDTGIALLAYMDGITNSPTLGGVCLAVFGAAGFAIFKVLFRKFMGDSSYGQRALFFSLMGCLSCGLLWPCWVGLYLAGAETFPLTPPHALTVAAASMLVFNLTYQFGGAVTYNMFVSLGLITAVPLSAALDVVLYAIEFEGMKLAGVILIAVGFFFVMFPDNWPDYIMRLLRWSRRQRGCGRHGGRGDATDFRTGYIRSHLRSPSGRVR